MPPCEGNSRDHCCWLSGKECPFLEVDTVKGRHWACGLLRKLGDWDAVLASPEYKSTVAPHYAHVKGLNCRDYPEKPHGRCGTCGYGGD